MILEPHPCLQEINLYLDKNILFQWAVSLNLFSINARITLFICVSSTQQTDRHTHTHIKRKKKYKKIKKRNCLLTNFFLVTQIPKDRQYEITPCSKNSNEKFARTVKQLIFQRAEIKKNLEKETNEFEHSTDRKLLFLFLAVLLCYSMFHVLQYCADFCRHKMRLLHVRRARVHKSTTFLDSFAVQQHVIRGQE